MHEEKLNLIFAAIKCLGWGRNRSPMIPQVNAALKEAVESGKESRHPGDLCQTRVGLRQAGLTPALSSQPMTQIGILRPMLLCLVKTRTTLSASQMRF